MRKVVDKTNAVVRSAQWAAFGDVMGFITELTSASGLMHRAGTKHVERPISWRRKIGGQFGVEAQLPEGCYSDDTQLRLATSRAIRGDGRFDVEAFAKVELTVWSAYALGAGRGSRAAADSLTRHVHTWSTNFFESNGIRYVDTGGNGAAMRVQPHVWAARNRADLRSFLPDVVRNSITTHGHPRGFLGAAFHALVLARTIEESAVPSISWVAEHIPSLRAVTALISDDVNLQDFWLKKWEKDSKRTLASAIDDVIREIQELVQLAASVESGDPEQMYRQICDVLDIRGDALRGSGTHTAVAAYFLALLFQDDPIGAVLTAANELGTDTDSIGTMAGALLGPVGDVRFPGAIQDAAYIEREALRLVEVSRCGKASTFLYPDLLHWQPPQSQSDAVGLIEGKTVVSGLGHVMEFGDVFRARGKGKGAWQWMSLDIGQRVLIKIREPLPALPTSSAPRTKDGSAKATVQQLTLTGDVDVARDAVRPDTRPEARSSDATVRGERFWQRVKGRSAYDQGFQPERQSSSSMSLPDIESLVDRIEESGFRIDLIGRYIERFASLGHGPELGALFASSVIRRMAKNRRTIS